MKKKIKKEKKQVVEIHIYVHHDYSSYQKYSPNTFPGGTGPTYPQFPYGSGSPTVIC